MRACVSGGGGRRRGGGEGRGRRGPERSASAGIFLPQIYRRGRHFRHAEIPKLPRDIFLFGNPLFLFLFSGENTLFFTGYTYLNYKAMNVFGVEHPIQCLQIESNFSLRVLSDLWYVSMHIHV